MDLGKTAPPEKYQGQCDKHGEFEGNVSWMLGRQFKSGCQKCHDERKEKEAEEKARSEAVLRAYRLAEKLGSAAIPPRFKEKTFDGYIAETERQKRALSICKGYADDFDGHYRDGRCLMLMGKPGCGKSHLSAAIAIHLCRETDHTAVYRTLPGLVHDIRASYDDNTRPTEGSIIQAITTCSLLVLDEVGATKTSEFELALLFNVINRRYEQTLPTLIVSNLAPSELKTAIGDRCVDRLREGGGIVVGFDWESKRGTL